VWYDFWTNEQVAGGRRVTRSVDLATTPLYVRAGAIIPFGPIKQYTEEKIDAPLTLRVYPGADGRFELYEDDGKTFNFRRGEWMGMQMGWTDKSRRLSIGLSKGSRYFGQRRFEVRPAGVTNARSISFDGKPISLRL
jgi:alpha-glucosidase (family GH31 glycosyl hydrolase)